MPNVKTIILTGGETVITFEDSYPYYMILNMGDDEIYASGNPGIEPYADGVYTIPVGVEVRISPQCSGDTVYLFGSGKVQVRAETIAVQTSFKLRGKGGDGNAGSNILPHSEGLTYYFDYQKNITDTSWTDMVSGYKINGGIVQNADHIGINQPTQLSWTVKNTFTAYCVSKFISAVNVTDTVGFFGTENNAKNEWFMLVRTPQNTAGLVFGVSAAGYETAISTSDYHIFAWNFFDGTVFFYIDGKHIVTKTNIRTLDRWVIGGTENLLPCFKMAAFFENVAQGADSIAENSRYLAQKYGLQI